MTATVKLKEDIVNLGVKFFNSEKYSTRFGKSYLKDLIELDLILFIIENNGECDKELTSRIRLIYEKYGIAM